MTNGQSQRHLYIVRHGEAKPKDVDPERGLTDPGRTNVTNMAAWAGAAGIRVDAIRHSGKLRAEQTAVIFAEHLGAQAVPAGGLAPNDDVTDIAKAIESETGDIMLVGHLPFLERLAGQLIAGGAHRGGVTLEAGALLELTLVDERWKATCLMQPRLLPST